jgi:plastocyanin
VGRRRRPLILAAAAFLAAAPAGAGTVVGQVVFTGRPPAPATLEVPKDREVCGERAPAEALVLGPGGGVRYAVVWIAGPDSGSPGPGPEAAIENRACRFVPPVQVARVGAELVVTNADPVLHNLRGWLEAGRSLFNVVQPTQGQVSRRTLRRAGVVRLTCDAHPHMLGWLVVFEHERFAVTDEAGRFAIADIPPGRHRLQLWHRGWNLLGQDAEGRPRWDPPRVLSREIDVGPGVTRVSLELRD